jgi:predicted nucleotidyltransferase
VHGLRERNGGPWHAWFKVAGRRGAREDVDWMLDDRTGLHAIAERTRAVLADGPPLRLAIVFGSVAKGTARPDSDIDIGILPVDANLSLSDEMDLQARLTLALRREVDLVRLDTTDTVLRWEAAKHGVIVHANPASERPLFLGQAASEHADFAEAVKPAMALYLRRMRERAARGGTQ